MNSRIDCWMQPNGVRAGGQRITNDQMNGDAFYGVLFSPSSYGSIARVTQPEWIEWATAATRTIGVIALTAATFGTAGFVLAAGGAVAGTAFGGADSYLGGGSFADGARTGMQIGAAGGAVLAALPAGAAFWTGVALNSAGTSYGVYDSLSSDRNTQAVFRGTLGLLGGVGQARAALSVRVKTGFTGAGLGEVNPVDEAAYAAIRASYRGDIDQVSRATGIGRAEIIMLKRHLFYGKHLQAEDGGRAFIRSRFVADSEIAYAWQLAQRQDLTGLQKQWFRQLVNHELGERVLMGWGVNYKQAAAWSSKGRWTGNPPGAHDLAPPAPRFGTFPGYRPQY